jgi:hypothetical protein
MRSTWDRRGRGCGEKKRTGEDLAEKEGLSDKYCCHFPF